jgi:predicted O-linked N-acetylglucosamine transferase (SPINDLY family)
LRGGGFAASFHFSIWADRVEDRLISTFWREAAKMDDNALRSMILDDSVDVLVDLAGHTSSHRLGVFAMRAAPVQVTFLGYPHSTGLSTIDWIIGDPTVTPAEHSALFSEGIAQLPNSVFCWASVDDYPLPPPRAAGLPPVFGSFNNVMKISPRTVALWARVLKTVPEAQLLLKAPSFREPAVQARFADLFAKNGIARERLIMRGPTGLADMMQEYGDIDIALDTWPYNGGTTSLQALWMGTPLVSLAGGNFVSRMGASFLKSMGRAEWAAYTEDEYVNKAVGLAKTCDELRKSRQSFRSAMEASPLCDIRTYTSDLENLFRQMRSVYRSGQTSRFLSIRG